MKNLVNNFISQLDDKLAWRFKELSDITIELKILKDEASISKKSFLLRGSVALIYAHWEGSVKDIFLEYINFINKVLSSNLLYLSKDTVFILDLILYKHREDKKFKGIICDITSLNKLLKTKTITLEIYKNNIKNNLQYYQKINKNDLSIKSVIVTKFLNKKTSDLKVLSNNFSTESNLGFEVLVDIFYKFDIDMTNEIEIEKYRIKQLLDNRNDIAHGDDNFFNESNNSKINNNIDTIQLTLEKIIELIKLIKYKLEKKSEQF